MSTEKEINDAIAIVQEAAREGRLQSKFEGIWGQSFAFSSASNNYRAKPDPVERWVVVFDSGYQVTYIKEKDAEREASKAHPSNSARIVYLREVQK